MRLGRGQGRATAPRAPEYYTPAGSTIGGSGHGGLWGGPCPTNQGPRGAHSFTKKRAGKGKRCDQRPRGTLKHSRAGWGSGGRPRKPASPPTIPTQAWRAWGTPIWARPQARPRHAGLQAPAGSLSATPPGGRLRGWSRWPRGAWSHVHTEHGAPHRFFPLWV